MNYSEMSDFEINKAVAMAQGYPEENCDFGWTGKPDVGVEWNDETGYPTKSFNYCNSWADAGPIIERNGISIEFDGDNSTDPKTMWCHVTNMQRTCGVDYQKSPLRAAMIVYLMMHHKGEE